MFTKWASHKSSLSGQKTGRNSQISWLKAYTLIGLVTNLHLVGKKWVEILKSAVTNLHLMGKKWVETNKSADTNIH